MSDAEQKSGNASVFLKWIGYAAVGTLAIGFVYISGFQLYTNDITPVVSRHTLSGTLGAVQQLPVNPKMLVHRGTSYKYTVRLDDGVTLAFVDDMKPRLVGSQVLLERRRHENGFEEYRILTD